MLLLSPFLDVKTEASEFLELAQEHTDIKWQNLDSFCFHIWAPHQYNLLPPEIMYV